MRVNKEKKCVIGKKAKLIDFILNLLYYIDEHDMNILNCTIALASGRAQARV